MKMTMVVMIVMATMTMMMMIMTLRLSGYHGRGLEAIPGKCAVRGNFIHSLKLQAF